MATGATGQLGLALPVQGELSGTWGDTVNNGITQYTNIAIAGTLTLTGDGAVTLSNTTGDASASNIVSTLTGAGTVTAQFAIVRVTGTLTTAKIITGPSYSKTYLVVNAATGSTVSFIRSGQTPAISIAVGESALVYFNGTDYVKLVGTATAGAAGGSTTQVQYNSSGVLAGSANMTFNGTTLTVNDLTDSSLTSGRVTYAGASGNLVDSANLTFNGTTLTANTLNLTNALGTAYGGTALTSFTSGGVVYASNSSALATGSALTFDGTNLGLNVSPSAWLSAVRVLQLGSVGGAFFIGNTTAGGGATIGLNAYYDTSWKYGASSFASYYSQINGAHQWFSAPSGTAGNAITFTQAMTLDASGNLLVGATSVAVAERLNVVGGNGIRVNEDGAGTKIITIRSNYAGTAPAINVTTDDPLLFLTNNTERARFTGSAGGSLLMGTTTIRTTGYTTGNSQYAMENTGYGGAQWFTNRTDSIGSFIVLGKSRGTVVNSNTIVANGDELGALVFQGTTGSGVASAAFVYAKVDGATISSSSMPGRLEFHTTASGSTAPTEYLRIASTGAFGLSGANYGTSGQVLTSGGSGAAPTWTTVGGGSSQWTTSGSNIYYSTGSVGIGNSTVVSKLDVRNGATNATGINTNANQISITHNSNTGVGNQADPAGFVVVRDKASAVSSGEFLGGLSWNARYTDTEDRAGYASILAVATGSGTADITFNTSSTNITTAERLRLNGNGALILSGGTVTADGVGITFPATQSASSNANTLDDYEEGTWTPAFAFGGGTTGMTYSVQSGKYIKVGNSVTCTGRIVFTNKGSSTGNATITGLPFTTGSGDASFSAASLLPDGITYTGAMFALATINSTTILVYNVTEAGTPTQLTNTNFSNSSQNIITITYLI